MLKKSVLALLFVGFTGILIWGGVNRTLAKSGETGSRGAETADHGNQGVLNFDVSKTVAQEQIHGNGFGVSTSNGNGSQSEGSSEYSSQGQGNQSRGNGGQGQGGGSRESLDADEIKAIYMALDDEYHALAVYQSVIDTFGPVEPFVEIAASEERHIGALVNQLTKNGLTIPENPWMGNIPPFESLEQACQTSVQAEIDNAALYDQLFSMTDDASLIRVFTNLSNASLNSHLPQFESCQ